jgi:hypothetical protein
MNENFVAILLMYPCYFIACFTDLSIIPCFDLKFYVSKQ